MSLREKEYHSPESLVTRRVAKVHQTSCHPGQLPQFHHHAHLSEKIQSWAPHAIHLTIDLRPWYLFCDLGGWSTALNANVWWPNLLTQESENISESQNGAPNFHCKSCHVPDVPCTVSPLQSQWLVWRQVDDLDSPFDIKGRYHVAVMVWQPELTCF